MAGGGAVGGVADFAQGGLNYAAAKEREEAARKWLEQAMADRQAGVNMAQNLDWSPERVRDQVGVFQRSRSPVADAFLESFVTGDNPAAIQGTRYGSKIEKADAQRRFNANYGGWDALRAQQRQLDESTPWAVQNPSGFTYGDEKAADKLTPDEVQKLRDLAGVNVGTKGEFISSVDGKPWTYGVFRDLATDSKGKMGAVTGPDYIARVRRFLAQLEKSGGAGPTLEGLRNAYRGSEFETYDNGGA